MNLITTTELRTKMPEVIATLLAGGKIELIHRSQIMGTITPMTPQDKTLSARELQKKIDALHLPRLTDKEIDRRYRAAMMKKHGQGLS
jgi:antitoxin (DNA-binding transcriptional repressor) of toxin-antitoxin stability system